MRPSRIDHLDQINMIDTHAHIHFEAYSGQVDAVLHRAVEAGVGKILTVGINSSDSQKAAELAATYENVWAAVGVHPHEAAETERCLDYLRDLATRRKVVAIGECGLDYYKGYSSRQDQQKSLRLQIELALELGLPVIFHVRDAFDDFFAIMNEYKNVRGVVHSFTADITTMEQVIERGWLIGLNGIMTFTKEESHKELMRRIPLDSLVLETDCPFLSPAGSRGKTNEPARIAEIAGFIAEASGRSLEELAASTTKNAERLLGI